MDGNIGIGGDPAALFRRVRQLLAPSGLLIAEAATAEVDERFDVSLDAGDGPLGPAFPWARLGPTALRTRAASEGWTTAGQWAVDGRAFVALRA